MRRSLTSCCGSNNSNVCFGPEAEVHDSAKQSFNLQTQQAAKPSTRVKGLAAFSREPTLSISVLAQANSLELIQRVALVDAEIAQSDVD